MKKQTNLSIKKEINREGKGKEKGSKEGKGKV